MLFPLFFFLLLFEIIALKPRVFRKQPPYVHEVVVRSAYTILPEPNLWDFTGYIVVVIVVIMLVLNLTKHIDLKSTLLFPLS